MSTIKAKALQQTVINDTTQPLKIGGIASDGSDAKISINSDGSISGIGQILQIVEGNTSTAVSSSTSTYVDTGLQVTLTPTKSTSKILILVNQNGIQRTATTANAIDFKLMRDTVELSFFARAVAELGAAYALEVGSVSTTVLDAPSTTSQITYKTQFCSRNNSASVSVQYASVSNSRIIAIEIGE